MPVILLLIGILSLLYPALQGLGERVVGDGGDTYLIIYLLEHSYLWITGAELHAELWNPPFFYPKENVLSYSDLLVSAAFPYWTARLLSFDSFSAFTLWLLTTSTLNFVAAYLLSRRLVALSSFEAGLVAYLFSFGSPRLFQVVHPQLYVNYFALFSAAFITYYIIQARKLNSRQKLSISLISAILFAAQWYAAFYIAFLSCLILGFFALTALLSSNVRNSSFRFLKENLRETLTFLLTSKILILPALLRYLDASKEVGLRSYADLFSRLPRPASWFKMGDESILYSWTQSAYNYFDFYYAEQNLGVGFFTVGLVIYGMRHHFKKHWLIVGTVLTTVVVSTAFFNTFSLWQFLYSFIPGVGAIRAPSRLILLLLFFYGLLLVFALRKLELRRSILTIVVTLVLVEQFRVIPSFSTSERTFGANAIAEVIPEDADCGAFIYTARDGSSPSWRYHLDAMWAGIIRDLPTINGYSGNQPPGWELKEVNIRGGVSKQIIRKQMLDWMAQNQLEALCWVRREKRDGGSRLIMRVIQASESKDFDKHIEGGM